MSIPHKAALGLAALLLIVLLTKTNVTPKSEPKVPTTLWNLSVYRYNEIFSR